MKRQHDMEQQGGGNNDPNPFVDAQVLNATLTDTITNTVVISGTAYVNQGGYIYNNSGGYIYFRIPIEGIATVVYPNRKHKWSTDSPSPPPPMGCVPNILEKVSD